MSEELVGVIITSVVTSIISIIGFVVTYKSMKRNFKEELEKEKQEAPVTDGTQQPTETEQAKEETAETPAAQ